MENTRPENNTPAGCGLLLYNSYSFGTKRGLYRADAAVWLGGDAAKRGWRRIGEFGIMGIVAPYFGSLFPFALNASPNAVSGPPPLGLV